MSGRIVFILIILLSLAGCEKDRKRLSGTDTIDNNLFGTGPYYAIGFSFSEGEKVPTTPRPGPDITLDNDGTIINLILQATNLNNSFFKTGEYADESAARQAFNALTEIRVSQWEPWAFGIKPYQVWVFRTGLDTYAKLRIISTASEAGASRDYAGCTFEWVYQPDGSLTFPPK